MSLDTGRTLFEHNADKLFVPASNTKLFTAALALHQPGPLFRIRTSLYGASLPDAGGLLHGDLTLFGRGDPSILAKGRGGMDPLEALAAQAWESGLRCVEGDLVGDDSFFSTPPYGSGWECDDLAFGFAAEPSALTIHANTVELRAYPSPFPGRPGFLLPVPGLGIFPLINHTLTAAGGGGLRTYRSLGDATTLVTGQLPLGSQPIQATVTVHDPALFFAQLLRRALLRHGISVKGAVRSIHFQQRLQPLDPASLKELGHLESPPLASLLRETLKHSLNLDAQLLFLQAGAATPGPGPNTEPRSLKALDAFLEASGVKPGQVLLEEGSGLSRRDLVTPEAIVALLSHMSRTPEGAVFRDALPVAGLDGTLRNRLAGTPAQGNLRAKTGTMRYNHALSGYATTATGERLAFSILLNQYHRDPMDPAPETELDRVALELLNY